MIISLWHKKHQPNSGESKFVWINFKAMKKNELLSFSTKMNFYLFFWLTPNIFILLEPNNFTPHGQELLTQLELGVLWMLWVCGVPPNLRPYYFKPMKTMDLDI